jgi:hypothetical protein
VLADSDGTIAALAVDQRNALRSLFARSERRSEMCFERNAHPVLTSELEKTRTRPKGNTPASESSRLIGAGIADLSTLAGTNFRRMTTWPRIPHPLSTGVFYRCCLGIEPRARPRPQIWHFPSTSSNKMFISTFKKHRTVCSGRIRLIEMNAIISPFDSRSSARAVRPPLPPKSMQCRGVVTLDI